jgi:hypothetical protein
LNSIILNPKKFAHDTKAVIGGQRVVFRTIAGYAKGNVEAMAALANFFQYPASHAVLLPASSIFDGDDLENAEWDNVMTLDVGDQVCDEFGRAFEIQRAFDRHFQLHQITLTH